MEHKLCEDCGSEERFEDAVELTTHEPGTCADATTCCACGAELPLPANHGGQA